MVKPSVIAYMNGMQRFTVLSGGNDLGKSRGKDLNHLGIHCELFLNPSKSLNPHSTSRDTTSCFFLIRFGRPNNIVRETTLVCNI